MTLKVLVVLIVGLSGAHSHEMVSAVVGDFQRLVFVPTEFSSGMLGYTYEVSAEKGEWQKINSEPVFPGIDNGMVIATNSYGLPLAGLTRNLEGRRKLGLKVNLSEAAIREVGSHAPEHFGLAARTCFNDFQLATLLGVGFQVPLDKFKHVRVSRVEKDGTTKVVFKTPLSDLLDDKVAFKFLEKPSIQERGDQLVITSAPPGASVRFVYWGNDGTHWVRLSFGGKFAQQRIDGKRFPAYKIEARGPCGEILDEVIFELSSAPSLIFPGKEAVDEFKVSGENGAIHVRFNSRTPRPGKIVARTSHLQAKASHATNTYESVLDKSYAFNVAPWKGKDGTYTVRLYFKIGDAEELLASKAIYFSNCVISGNPEVFLLEDSCNHFILGVMHPKYSCDVETVSTVLFKTSEGDSTVDTLLRVATNRVMVSKEGFGRQRLLTVSVLSEGIVKSDDNEVAYVDGGQSAQITVTNTVTTLPIPKVSDLEVSSSNVSFRCTGWPEEDVELEVTNYDGKILLKTVESAVNVTGKVSELREIRLRFGSDCWKSHVATIHLPEKIDDDKNVRLTVETTNDPHMCLFKAHLSSDLLGALDRLVLRAGPKLIDFPLTDQNPTILVAGVDGLEYQALGVSLSQGIYESKRWILRKRRGGGSE